MDEDSKPPKRRTALERERRRAGLSQSRLAEDSGISQSTISRTERGIYTPGIDVFAKLARAMGVAVSEIAPEAISELNNPFEYTFFAFCPNLLCDRNQLQKANGQMSVRWKSYREYQASEFDEVNFCSSCGTDLIKECPSCTRRLLPGAKFCLACGTKIVQPTKEQWKAASDWLDAKGPDLDDDIPF